MTEKSTALSASTSRQPVSRALAVTHSVLALLALMMGVAMAGIALVVAAVAVPFGLVVQAVAAEPVPARRRGWQPVTA